MRVSYTFLKNFEYILLVLLLFFMIFKVISLSSTPTFYIEYKKESSYNPSSRRVIYFEENHMIRLEKKGIHIYKYNYQKFIGIKENGTNLLNISPYKLPPQYYGDSRYRYKVFYLPFSRVPWKSLDDPEGSNNIRIFVGNLVLGAMGRFLPTSFFIDKIKEGYNYGAGLNTAYYPRAAYIAPRIRNPSVLRDLYLTLSLIELNAFGITHVIFGSHLTPDWIKNLYYVIMYKALSSVPANTLLPNYLIVPGYVLNPDHDYLNNILGEYYLNELEREHKMSRAAIDTIINLNKYVWGDADKRHYILYREHYQTILLDPTRWFQPVLSIHNGKWFFFDLGGRVSFYPPIKVIRVLNDIYNLKKVDLVFGELSSYYPQELFYVKEYYTHYTKRICTASFDNICDSAPLFSVPFMKFRMCFTIGGSVFNPGFANTCILSNTANCRSVNLFAHHYKNNYMAPMLPFGMLIGLGNSLFDVFSSTCAKLNKYVLPFGSLFEVDENKLGCGCCCKPLLGYWFSLPEVDKANDYDLINIPAGFSVMDSLTNLLSNTFWMFGLTGLAFAGFGYSRLFTMGPHLTTYLYDFEYFRLNDENSYLVFNYFVNPGTMFLSTFNTSIDWFVLPFFGVRIPLKFQSTYMSYLALVDDPLNVLILYLHQNALSSNRYKYPHVIKVDRPNYIHTLGELKYIPAYVITSQKFEGETSEAYIVSQYFDLTDYYYFVRFNVENGGDVNVVSPTLRTDTANTVALAVFPKPHLENYLSPILPLLQFNFSFAINTKFDFSDSYGVFIIDRKIGRLILDNIDGRDLLRISDEAMADNLEDFFNAYGIRVKINKNGLINVYLQGHLLLGNCSSFRVIPYIFPASYNTGESYGTLIGQFGDLLHAVFNLVTPMSTQFVWASRLYTANSIGLVWNTSARGDPMVGGYNPLIHRTPLMYVSVGLFLECKNFLNPKAKCQDGESFCFNGIVCDCINGNFVCTKMGECCPGDIKGDYVVVGGKKFALPSEATYTCVDYHWVKVGERETCSLRDLGINCTVGCYKGRPVSIKTETYFDPLNCKISLGYSYEPESNNVVPCCDVYNCYEYESCSCVGNTLQCTRRTQPLRCNNPLIVECESDRCYFKTFGCTPDGFCSPHMDECAKQCIPSDYIEAKWKNGHLYGCFYFTGRVQEMFIKNWYNPRCTEEQPVPNGFSRAAYSKIPQYVDLFENYESRSAKYRYCCFKEWHYRFRFTENHMGIEDYSIQYGTNCRGNDYYEYDAFRHVLKKDANDCICVCPVVCGEKLLNYFSIRVRAGGGICKGKWSGDRCDCSCCYKKIDLGCGREDIICRGTPWRIPDEIRLEDVNKTYICYDKRIYRLKVFDIDVDESVFCIDAKEYGTDINFAKEPRNYTLEPIYNVDNFPGDYNCCWDFDCPYDGWYHCSDLTCSSDDPMWHRRFMKDPYNLVEYYSYITNVIGSNRGGGSYYYDDRNFTYVLLDFWCETSDKCYYHDKIPDDIPKDCFGCKVNVLQTCKNVSKRPGDIDPDETKWVVGYNEGLYDPQVFRIPIARIGCDIKSHTDAPSGLKVEKYDLGMLLRTPYTGYKALNYTEVPCTVFLRTDFKIIRQWPDDTVSCDEDSDCVDDRVKSHIGQDNYVCLYCKNGDKRVDYDGEDCDYVGVGPNSWKCQLPPSGTPIPPGNLYDNPKYFSCHYDVIAPECRDEYAVLKVYVGSGCDSASPSSLYKTIKVYCGYHCPSGYDRCLSPESSDDITVSTKEGTVVFHVSCSWKDKCCGQLSISVDATVNTPPVNCKCGSCTCTCTHCGGSCSCSYTVTYCYAIKGTYEIFLTDGTSLSSGSDFDDDCTTGTCSKSYPCPPCPPSSGGGGGS